MYEFVGLCYDMVQYLNREAPVYGINSCGQVTNEKGEIISEAVSKEQRREQYPIPCAVFDKFEILSQQFKQKLLGNDLGITKDSPLYRLYYDLYIGVGTYKAYGDTPLKQKLGGVALYIAQKKREVIRGLINSFSYDNHAEMDDIIRLNQELHDPQSVGYYTGSAGETDINKMTYAAAEPSSRQLLLEEIMNEYNKGSKTR